MSSASVPCTQPRGVLSQAHAITLCVAVYVWIYHLLLYKRACCPQKAREECLASQVRIAFFRRCFATEQHAQERAVHKGCRQRARMRTRGKRCFAGMFAREECPQHAPLMPGPCIMYLELRGNLTATYRRRCCLRQRKGFDSLKVGRDHALSTTNYNKTT